MRTKVAIIGAGSAGMRAYREVGFGGVMRPDHVPVLKLFTPDANATWLITEIDPENPDLAFGLCDLGLGCPEIGSLSIAEVSGLRGALGLPVERDLHITLDQPLSVYADRARAAGHIVTTF